VHKSITGYINKRYSYWRGVFSNASSFSLKLVYVKTSVVTTATRTWALLILSGHRQWQRSFGTKKWVLWGRRSFVRILNNRDICCLEASSSQHHTNNKATLKRSIQYGRLQGFRIQNDNKAQKTIIRIIKNSNINMSTTATKRNLFIWKRGSCWCNYVYLKAIWNNK
jgi:hypothetical protein